VTIERRVGRFRLERALGTGAFSTVWLAHDEHLEGLVALKILAENWSQSEDARRRFADEARALRRLDSDRIVRVYELAHLSDGRPYMVMEFADRGSLEDRMRFAHQTGSPFSASEVAAIGIELAACLASVHAGRIVHRDVKPSNVLFRTVPPEVQEVLRKTGRPAPSDRMLLGDFGIARRMEMAGLTQVVGSPQYMAPEQADPASASTVDNRADIYSAGVVLFELLAGGPPPTPYLGEDVANDPFAPRSPDIRALRDDVPDLMAAAIERAMARRPVHRYATAWEFRQELVRSLGEPVSRRQYSPPPVTPPPVPSDHWRDAEPAATAVARPATPTRPLPTPLEGHAARPQAPISRPDRPRTPPRSPLRLGLLDAAALASVAGAILIVASLLPWRSAEGLVDGIQVRTGTVVFAAGGAMVLAGLVRWAARGKWGLRLIRLLSLLGGLATLAAVAYQVVATRGTVSAILAHGVYANLGVGLYLTLPAAVLAFVAAGRAKRQLRALRFWLLADATARQAGFTSGSASPGTSPAAASSRPSPG
jgi:serine/threonine protein kinase